MLSLLKELNPKYSLEGLTLKLKLQYFGHLMQRADSLERTLMLGKIEGRGRRGWQRKMAGWHHRLNGHESEQAPRDGEGEWSQACHSPWGCKESDMIEQLNNSVGREEYVWNCLIAFLSSNGSFWTTAATTAWKDNEEIKPLGLATQDSQNTGWRWGNTIMSRWRERKWWPTSNTASLLQQGLEYISITNLP